LTIKRKKKVAAWGAAIRNFFRIASHCGVCHTLRDDSMGRVRVESMMLNLPEIE